MVIILIRRCVRSDRENEFLASYIRDKPKHADFIDEHLTKVDANTSLHHKLRNLPLACDSGITYVNVAMWKSLAGFIETFGKNFEFSHDPEIECGPRTRIVLNKIP